MYIIIEGMPSSGKTTLAKKAAEKYGSVYFKSVLSGDSFGQQLRKVRDTCTDGVAVDLLHIVDLFRNEIQISKLISEGRSVVRDKCFLSSLAHILSIDEDINGELKNLLRDSFDEIAKNMVVPDAVFLINSDYYDSSLRINGKTDTSQIDNVILGDKIRFETQYNYLKSLAEQYFPNRIFYIDGNISISEEIEILENVLKVV